jgi:hypothetical protein
MKNDTIESFLKIMPVEKVEFMTRIRQTIIKNLPLGLIEKIDNDTISYVVPFSIYPNGYHVNPSKELPFITIALKKNHIALYYFPLYVDNKLLQWFLKEYPKYNLSNINIGKSCIRFMKGNDIPFNLISKLVKKTSVESWIIAYEKFIYTRLKNKQ